MQKMDGFKTAFVLEVQQVEKLDEIATRFKIKRSEALRRIIEIGLDVYEIYEGVGVVSLVELVKKMKSAIRQIRQPRFI